MGIFTYSNQLFINRLQNLVIFSEIAAFKMLKMQTLKGLKYEMMLDA